MLRESLKGVSFFYTDTYTILCGHCSTCSSPQRTRKINFGLAERALADAIDLGCRLVSFTGGESLIHRDEVLALARTARGAHMKILVMTSSRISSAQWNL